MTKISNPVSEQELTIKQEFVATYLRSLNEQEFKSVIYDKINILVKGLDKASDKDAVKYQTVLYGILTKLDDRASLEDYLIHF